MIDMLDDLPEIGELQKMALRKFFKTTMAVMFPQLKGLSFALTVLKGLYKNFLKTASEFTGISEEKLNLTGILDTGFNYLEKIEKSEIAKKWLTNKIEGKNTKDASKDSSKSSSSEPAKKEEPSKDTVKKTKRKTNGNNLAKDSAKVLTDAQIEVNITNNIFINQFAFVFVNNMCQANGVQMDPNSIIDVSNLMKKQDQDALARQLEGSFKLLTYTEANKVRNDLGLDPLPSVDVEILQDNKMIQMYSESDLGVTTVTSNGLLQSKTTVVEKENSIGSIELTYDSKHQDTPVTKVKCIEGKDFKVTSEYQIDDNRERLSKYTEEGSSLSREFDYETGLRTDKYLDKQDITIVTNHKGNEIVSTSSNVRVIESKDDVKRITNDGTSMENLEGKVVLLGFKEEKTMTQDTIYGPITGTIQDAEYTDSNCEAVIKHDGKHYYTEDLGSKKNPEEYFNKENEIEEKTVEAYKENQALSKENAFERKNEFVAE